MSTRPAHAMISTLPGLTDLQLIIAFRSKKPSSLEVEQFFMGVEDHTRQVSTDPCTPQFSPVTECRDTLHGQEAQIIKSGRYERAMHIDSSDRNGFCRWQCEGTMAGIVSVNGDTEGATQDLQSTQRRRNLKDQIRLSAMQKPLDQGHMDRGEPQVSDLDSSSEYLDTISVELSEISVDNTPAFDHFDSHLEEPEIRSLDERGSSDDMIEMKSSNGYKRSRSQKAFAKAPKDDVHKDKHRSSPEPQSAS